VRHASTLALIALATSALAQQPSARTAARQSDTGQPDRATQLPVTRVSLYKNGVGFFELTGRVTGDQSVTIDFTTAQLNDVLQSLTAIDLNGGRIAGAGYNSTTPLEQQLKALPLALGEDPTAVDFYNAIRGARVEVRTPAASITGRLLNIEVVTQPGKDGEPAGEKRMLTVISDAGEVRTVELTPATQVRLLDADLHNDVTRYLQLLASTRNQGLRHLTLQDNGTGTRSLMVSYISEVPIWKSTYRILFNDAPATAAKIGPAARQTATLQGWSVVDNTTGADWINVHLSLIAGSPQSFIQPLSVPYYSRRPEIPLPQEAQLSPQTHDEGDAAPMAASRPMPVMAASPMAKARRGVALGSGSGGVMGGIGSAPLQQIFAESAIDALSDDPTEFNALAQASITPNTTTSAFDDYFEYKLSDPITIRKNESAMVPILQTKIDTERVTLVASNGNTTSMPLRALWITNTSDLTLDRGSFSIVENGSFGGEGLLEPLHPQGKRLLSYAVDQAVRVTTDGNENGQHIDRVSAAKGVLTLHHADRREVTYVVRNAAPETRTVILEHPVQPGYTLEATDSRGVATQKPEETTPTVYRYRVVVAPRETVRLRIGATHRGTTTYVLTRSDDNQLALILRQTGDNPALNAALQPILAARRHQADMQVALDKVNATLTALHADEDRERANVTALTAADKGARERFVHDLNQTEDKIAATQKDLVTAQANLQAAKDDLAAKIEALQIDEHF
jgi:hypothetical protein